MRLEQRVVVVAAVAISLSTCGDDGGAGGGHDGGGDAGVVGADAGDLDADAPDAGQDLRFGLLAAAIEADIEGSNATAASVAVWLDEEVVWVGGFGSLGEGAGRIDEDTLFMIGSDTKKITAIGLLRLVAAGQASLETTVADVLPDLEMTLAPDFVGATIHDLISHQGGILDGVETATEADDEGLRAFVFGELAESYYPLAPPGRIWNYSNPNFSVAGLLHQELDGRPWADIVEQDVFAPLGMSRTVARKTEVDANHATGIGVTTGDDPTIGPVSLDETWESAFVRPSGLVWSTPSDQIRLARFLVDGDGTVLGDDRREELSTPQVPLFPDIPGSYGYGLFVERGTTVQGAWYDVPVWSHGGGTWTHTSTFVILPEQRFAISILSNGLADDFTRSVVTAIESLVELPEPATEPPLPFDAGALDGLVGTYVDDFNVGELVISREGDALRIDAPLLDQYEIPYEREMTPLSTRVWIASVQGEELDFSFVDGPDGETYLRNRAIVAIRPAAGAGARHERRRSARRPEPDAAALRAALLRARLDPLPPLCRLRRAWR
ncbi:MAG: beta-lactamase family protein [Deltaproteobacteria bacterium]|nr:beta-lactamase family protein [Deltaproteobacteria bacterium]